MKNKNGTGFFLHTVVIMGTKCEIHYQSVFEVKKLIYNLIRLFNMIKNVYIWKLFPLSTEK